jgi:hypothetical protein
MCCKKIIGIKKFDADIIALINDKERKQIVQIILLNIMSFDSDFNTIIDTIITNIKSSIDFEKQAQFSS